jgi:hypothetical protein
MSQRDKYKPSEKEVDKYDTEIYDDINEEEPEIHVDNCRNDTDILFEYELYELLTYYRDCNILFKYVNYNTIFNGDIYRVKFLIEKDIHTLINLFTTDLLSLKSAKPKGLTRDIIVARLYTVLYKYFM